MPASTTLITDANTMITNGSTAATLANSINPADKIQDVPGGQVLILNSLKQLKTLYVLIQSVTDAGDPNYSTLTNDILTLS